MSGTPSWLTTNKGLLGPPIAHLAAGTGMLLAIGLAQLLGSMGYMTKPWSVVLVLAGYAIPFAVACRFVKGKNT